MISCNSHGERVSAVICQHLLQGQRVPAGFVENNNDPNDLQAGCHLCEEKFQLEGGMTNAFREFNGMTVICVACYAEAKERHAVAAS